MEYLTGFLIGVCLMMLIDKFVPYRARNKPATETKLTKEEKEAQKRTQENMQKIFNFDVNQAYRRKSE